MTLSAILRAVADAERYPPGPVADAERNPRAPAVALSPTRGAGLQTLLKPLSSIGHIGLLILTLLKPLSSIGRYVSGAEHMSRGPGTAVSAIRAGRSVLRESCSRSRSRLSLVSTIMDSCPVPPG